MRAMTNRKQRGVRVCAKHIGEIVGDGCVICELEEAEQDHTSLDFQLAEARQQAGERILIRTIHDPDKGLVNVYATAEDYIALERGVERLKGEVEQAQDLVRVHKEVIANLTATQGELKGYLAASHKEIAELRREVERLKAELTLRSGIGEMVSVFAERAAAQAREKALEWAQEQLRVAVNIHCRCGGHGPKDNGVCGACLVWHQFKVALKSKETT